MARKQLRDLATVMEEDSLSVLGAILKEGKIIHVPAKEPDETDDELEARTEKIEAFAGSLIGELADSVLAATPDKQQDLVTYIEKQIEAIDDELSDKLSAVMHHEDFQELESTWRGLHYFVHKSETGERLKLRVLDATKQEVLDDMAKAVDVDQSHLFKSVYEAEYGTFGGHPFGVLLSGYAFGDTKPDQDFLTMISKVAACAHAPFIAGTSPRLFDKGSFEELVLPRDLSKIFATDAMAPWRSFRDSEDSRYVSLTLPRFMLRAPWDSVNNPVPEFNFEERTDGTRHGAYLWGNSSWALGARITDAFAKYGWCAAIRGVEGGGKVEGLPIHAFNAEDGTTEVKCPTEVSITDRREKELSDLGFISLVHCKGEDYAAFFSGTTVNKPREYLVDAATANARLSGQLPYMLAASRFAHYLKVIVRDKVGSFQTADEISKYLNDWIAQYVLLADDAPQSTKARYPLREARVDVSEVSGKPGVYNAVVFLRPHFQLEELTASIRLVAELPPPAA